MHGERFWKNGYRIFSLKFSAIHDRLNNAMKEEYILLDQTEIDSSVDLKITGWKKDIEKDEILNKYADVLKAKKVMQIINLKNNWDNLSILDLQ